MSVYEEVVEVAASRRRAIMRVLMRLREERGGPSIGGGRSREEAVRPWLLARQAVEDMVEVVEWSSNAGGRRLLRVKL